MAAKKIKKTKKRVRVGDKVRFDYATREVVADVVRDLGPIGIDGRQLVVVAIRLDADEGGDRRIDMPVEELTVIARPRASSSRR